MVLAAGSHGGVGKEHPHDQKNYSAIYPGKLRRCDPSDPIRVDIFTTCDKKYGMRVCGSEKYYSGNLFSSPLLRKIEISPIHCNNIKYITGQEIRHGPTKYSDVIR